MHAIDAIRGAAGEPEHVEALLELPHVITMKVGEAQVEGPVAELVALVDKNRPRGGVNGLAEREPVVEPEACDRRGRGATKGALGALRLVHRVPDPAESLLNVLDGSSRRALTNGFHSLSRARARC